MNLIYLVFAKRNFLISFKQIKAPKDVICLFLCLLIRKTLISVFRFCFDFKQTGSVYFDALTSVYLNLIFMTFHLMLGPISWSSNLQSKSKKTKMHVF